MSPEQIRAHVDGLEPRTLPGGQINARHVALEITLRDRHGHPHFIASLDGPGKFRRGPEPAGDLDRFAAAVEDLRRTVLAELDRLMSPVVARLARWLR